MPKDMSGPEVFALSRQMAEELLGWLESPEASQLDHAALEGALDERAASCCAACFRTTWICEPYERPAKKWSARTGPRSARSRPAMTAAWSPSSAR